MVALSLLNTLQNRARSTPGLWPNRPPWVTGSKRKSCPKGSFWHQPSGWNFTLKKVSHRWALWFPGGSFTQGRSQTEGSISWAGNKLRRRIIVISLEVRHCLRLGMTSRLGHILYTYWTWNQSFASHRVLQSTARSDPQALSNSSKQKLYTWDHASKLKELED